MNIFDLFDTIPDNGGGGDGYIGKVKLDAGVTFLKSGYSCADFFVPFANESEYEPAKIQLRAEAREAGVGKINPTKAIRLTLYADTLKGAKRRDNDRTWVFATFFMSYYDPDVGIAQALQEVGMISNGEYWCHLKFAKNPDETRPKRYDAEGNERPDLFPYPVAVFANEAEATAAGEAQGGTPESEEIEPWKTQLVHEAFAGGMSKDAILAKYQGAVSLEEVDAIISNDTLFDDIPF